MENEVSILDSVFKTCAACGKTRTLRNYRLLPRAEFGDGVVHIADKFNKVCKCCESHPEQQLKANRLEVLKTKMARFKTNEAARLERERDKEFEKEEGIIVYKK